MKKISLPRKIRIPLIYGIFSILWIVFSDRFAFMLAGNMESAKIIAVIKGTAFVVVSTLLIFLLLAVDERRETKLKDELTGLKDSFTKLYEKNPQSMLIGDPETTQIITANEAALNQFEYERDEFLHLHLGDLIVPEELELLTQSIEKNREGFRKTGPWRCLSKNRKMFYCYAMFTRIDLSGRSADLITVIDITEQKEIEDTLKKTESERDNFEAFGFSISHDLRSSLRTISGYSQIMMEDYKDRLDEKGLGYLEQLRQASQSMNQTLDSLLMLTGITHRNLDIDYVNLGGIAVRVADQLKKQDPGRSVTFKLVNDVIARCDADLMRMALYDLMENSWKYTSKEPDPVIEFGLKINQNGERVFFVRDNGIGFDPAKGGEIFKPFTRLHSAAEFKGSGVGLSVVSRIIERHKGRIWAESAYGKGATFCFTLGLDEEKLTS